MREVFFFLAGVGVGVVIAAFIARWAFRSLRVQDERLAATLAAVDATRERIQEGARGTVKGRFKL